jgi:hypothetical protein
MFHFHLVRDQEMRFFYLYELPLMHHEEYRTTDNTKPIPNFPKHLFSTFEDHEHQGSVEEFSHDRKEAEESTGSFPLARGRAIGFPESR